MPEITLSVAYGTKTWLAEITGDDPRFGLTREFVNAVESNMSRSGRTGSKTYRLAPGRYESQDRSGRRYWLVTDGAVTETDREFTAVADPAPGSAPSVDPVQAVAGALGPAMAVGLLGQTVVLTSGPKPEPRTLRVDAIELNRKGDAVVLRCWHADGNRTVSPALADVTSWHPARRG